MEIIIPNWPAPKNIKAFSSTRIGGFSSAPYDGLNLGTHVGDDPAVVAKNRLLLQRYSMMPTSPIWLNQTHSTIVLQVNQPTTDILNADGLFTRCIGVVCAAMTADCVPVLLTDSKGTQVAAVHAGWRGLASGIVEQALRHFDGEVMAWIGPAIGKESFEVGDDVLEAFCHYAPQAREAFQSKLESGKYLADMNKLVTQRLNKCGVTQVYYSQLCTYQNEQQFYSYRRDSVTGRQATFIWIES